MKHIIILSIPVIILCSITSNVYAHGWHPHPKISVPIKIEPIKVPELEIIRVEADLEGDAQNIIDKVTDTKIVHIEADLEADLNELKEWDIGDDIVWTLNHYGDQFASAICHLVGGKEGEDCHVGGGGNCDSDGNCNATDGSGNPVSTPPSKDSEIPSIEDILAWNSTITITDLFSERYMVGSLAIFFSGDMANASGVTWLPQTPISPTEKGKLRTAKDGHGRGLVGARRQDKDGNYRLHRGTDYITTPGENIKAPIGGIVNVIPMTGKPFSLITITNQTTGHQTKVFYVTNISISNGDVVNAGDSIAKADNLHKPNGYPSTVPNHTHVEHLSPEGHSIAPNNKYAIVKRDTDGLNRWVELCTKTKCYDPES